MLTDRDLWPQVTLALPKFGQHAEAQTHACGCQALTHEGEACALARHVAICENPTAIIIANARKAQDRAMIFGNFFLIWQALRPKARQF